MTKKLWRYDVATDTLYVRPWFAASAGLAFIALVCLALFAE
jgi:hypothetical protein